MVWAGPRRPFRFTGATSWDVLPVCFVIPQVNNAQKQQLEQEIGERKAIEADLRATQDELIQTAKLAVVGQTMTTTAHEINQPLNALSMYLLRREGRSNRDRRSRRG